MHTQLTAQPIASKTARQALYNVNSLECMVQSLGVNSNMPLTVALTSASARLQRSASRARRHHQPRLLAPRCTKCVNGGGGQSSIQSSSLRRCCAIATAATEASGSPTPA